MKGIRLSGRKPHVPFMTDPISIGRRLKSSQISRSRYTSSSPFGKSRSSIERGGALWPTLRARLDMAGMSAKNTETISKRNVDDELTLNHRYYLQQHAEFLICSPPIILVP